MGHSTIPAAPTAADTSPPLTSVQRAPLRRALVLLRLRRATPGCTDRPSCDGRCWPCWAYTLFYHATRSPKYAGRLLARAPRGTARTASAQSHPRRIWGWRG